MRIQYLLLLAGAGAGALAGCGSEKSSAAEVSPNTVTVTATDYRFDAPDSIPAGVTALRLVNQGKELHHLQLVRLDQGKTMQDLLAAFAAGGPPPSWVTLLGGPNAVEPGKANSVVQRLTPGQYGFLCFIPSNDGVPHVMKGMESSFRVVPSADTLAREPEADVEVRLVDYGFKLSGPLSRGPLVIRIENEAEQPHELVLIRLKPGRTAKDMADWELGGRQGEAPGTWVGGVVGLMKGQHSNIAVNLEAGLYGLICFLPDASDGKPHFMHDMAQEIEVS